MENFIFCAATLFLCENLWLQTNTDVVYLRMFDLSFAFIRDVSIIGEKVQEKCYFHEKENGTRLTLIWVGSLMNWWWTVSVVWLTDERRLALFPARDHCQRSWPSPISDTPWAGFEPTQNLSSGLVEWSCAVAITITPRRLEV